MNEILDLERDLHANDSALSEEYRFGTRTLSSAFPSLSERERVSLLSMLGVSSRLLLTLHMSASVSWRRGCVFVYAYCLRALDLRDCQPFHLVWLGLPPQMHPDTGSPASRRTFSVRTITGGYARTDTLSFHSACSPNVGLAVHGAVSFVSERPAGDPVDGDPGAVLTHGPHLSLVQGERAASDP